MLGPVHTQSTGSAPGEPAAVLEKRQPADGTAGATAGSRPGTSPFLLSPLPNCEAVSTQGRATAGSGWQHGGRGWVASAVPTRDRGGGGLRRVSVLGESIPWWGAWVRVLLCGRLRRVCLFPAAAKAAQPTETLKLRLLWSGANILQNYNCLSLRWMSHA